MNGGHDSDFGRPVAGTRLVASPIGLRLLSAPRAGLEADPGAARLLVRARALGITTFDVGRGAEAARAERILAAAFPRPDESLLVIARRSATDLANGDARSGGIAAPSDLDARLRRSLEESASRLRSLTIGLLVWDRVASGAPGPDPTRSFLDGLVSEGRIGGWAEQVRVSRSLTSEPGASGRGTGVYSGPLSVLERGLLAPLEARAADGPLSFFAEDPLGAGRLDGSRFEQPLADRGPSTPPVGIAELHREFDPVLRLGFLTARGGRTLAQAALQFVLRWPWVSSALVPVPRAERLAEIASVAASAPLDDDEVQRILARPE